MSDAERMTHEPTAAPAGAETDPAAGVPATGATASPSTGPAAVPAGAVDPAAGAHPRTEGHDEALAALADNDAAREVDAPDPETLTSEMPPLADIPDAAPKGAPSPLPAGAMSDRAEDTAEIDHIELAALMADSASPSQTLPFEPVKVAAPSPAVAVERISGAAKGTGSLAWGSRTDIGRVRTHNEDSFVIRFPLFVVADGMGGHAAGEVASTIAVSSLATTAPNIPDAAALGSAVEAANRSVIEGASSGLGRPGMGTTCTAVIIDGQNMAVGHVGDSRCYLLHAGQLVRVTHDHSYVEELVAAGEITPEEARIHPNRSIITRALGSDPGMKADHFMVEVARGDRVMLCSDGLSSMIGDDAIEEAMVSSPAPQACADALVDLALEAGGHDNVTCIVVDVKDDGVASRALKMRLRNIGICLAVALVVLLGTWLALYGVSRGSWYLADANGHVALYRGIPGLPAFLGLNELKETSAVETDLLSEATARKLAAGITFASEDEARATVADYYAQVVEGKDTGKAAAPDKAPAPDQPSAANAGATSGTPGAGDQPAATDADGDAPAADDSDQPAAPNAPVATDQPAATDAGAAADQPAPAGGEGE